MIPIKWEGDFSGFRRTYWFTLSEVAAQKLLRATFSLSGTIYTEIGKVV